MDTSQALRRDSHIFRAATVGQYCAAAALALMTLHIALAGLLRSVFDSPIEGASDLTGTYYMATVIALPLARVHQTTGLLKADALESYFSPRVRRVLTEASRWLCVMVCGYACIASIILARDLTHHAAAVELSESQFAAWPAAWIPPLGLALLAVALIAGPSPQSHAGDDTP